MDKEGLLPRAPSTSPEQQRNRIFSVTWAERQLVNQENCWQTIKEVPESDAEIRLQRALLRTTVADLKNDDYYAREFWRRAECSIQNLATIFLGHSLDTALLRECWLSIGTEAHEDPYRYIDLVHQIRRLINYEHTNPASVFLIFCEFLAEHFRSLSVVGLAEDAHGKYRIAYFPPYHAPSFPGLTNHIRIVTTRLLNSTLDHLTVIRVDWESLDASRVGVLEPSPEPTEEQEQTQQL